MNIIVMKFGGTSVSSIEKLKNIVNIVSNEVKKNKVVVVLSAMAGETNKLQKYLDAIDSEFPLENDLVLTSGEQVTIGLLSSILNKKNIKAMPLLGWLIPIKTDDNECPILSCSTPQKSPPDCLTKR